MNGWDARRGASERMSLEKALRSSRVESIETLLPSSRVLPRRAESGSTTRGAPVRVLPRGDVLLWTARVRSADGAPPATDARAVRRQARREFGRVVVVVVVAAAADATATRARGRATRTDAAARGVGDANVIASDAIV